MGLQIRLYGSALPCVAQQKIESGSAVKLIKAANPGNAVLAGSSYPDPRLQGAIYDVTQGAILPTTDDDAEARYVAAFRVYNEVTPIYEGIPNDQSGTGTIPYTLREFGPQGTTNLPATVVIRMIQPRFEETATIASGALMLAYDDGIYTVTSGVYSGASFSPGSKISVKAGGIWYQGDTARVGIVWEYNSSMGQLTIKTGR